MTSRSAGSRVLAGDERLAAELSSRLGTYIKQAEQALIAAKSQALREFDLTVPQYVALMALHYSPGQSAAHLARTAVVTPQTMATILRNLEVKGLIGREHSTLHSKVLVTRLTVPGETLALKADRKVRKVEDRLAEIFDDTRLDQLREDLIAATTELRSIEAELR